MPSEALRSPVPVSGAAFREMPRCIPVVDTRPVRDTDGALTDRVRRGVYAGNNSVKADEGLVVWTAWAAERTTWPTYIGALLVDWSDPAALEPAIRWLMDRGHRCDWMRPLRYGGRVPAWDGLTEDAVAAILVSVSVREVAAGRGPVIDLGHRIEGTVDGVIFYHGTVGETHRTASTAPSSGWALLVPGGVMVPRG